MVLIFTFWVFLVLGAILGQDSPKSPPTSFEDQFWDQFSLIFDHFLVHFWFFFVGLGLHVGSCCLLWCWFVALLVCWLVGLRARSFAGFLVCWLSAGRQSGPRVQGLGTGGP